MVAGVAAVDAVVAVGIGQLAEVLVSLHEGFGVFLRIAEMHVVVGKAVNEQQLAAELCGTADGTDIVACAVLAGGAHEALGVDGVVVAPAGGSRHSHTCGKDGTPLAHAHQGVEAAVAPAPDGDAVLVNIRLLSEPYGCLHLVVALQLAELEVGALLEVPAPTACATTVHTDADEALLGLSLIHI